MIVQKSRDTVLTLVSHNTRIEISIPDTSTITELIDAFMAAAIGVGYSYDTVADGVLERAEMLRDDPRALTL